MRAEAWWASRGGSSDGKNAKEGGQGRERSKKDKEGGVRND